MAALADDEQARTAPRGHGGHAGPADQDPLVESLLLLHGLHPLDVDARIQRALDQVRPYLGSHAGGVQYLGVSDGVARLRLEGSCDGCPSSTVTVQLAIEGAVQDAAPEVTEVVVEGDDRGAGGARARCCCRSARGRTRRRWPTRARDGGRAASWVTLPDIGPPSARPVTATAGDLPIAASARSAARCTPTGTRCAACGSALADGQLAREVLTCPCGAVLRRRRAGPRAGRPHPAPGPAAAAHRQPGRPGGGAGGGRAGPVVTGRVTGRGGLGGRGRFVPGAPATPPPAPVEAPPVLFRCRIPFCPVPGRPPLPSDPQLPASFAASEVADEKCELCAERIPAEHGHVADLEKSSLLCACRACYLLFTQSPGRAGAGTGRCRTGTWHDPEHPLTPR